MAARRRVSSDGAAAAAIAASLAGAGDEDPAVGAAAVGAARADWREGFRTEVLSRFGARGDSEPMRLLLADYERLYAAQVLAQETNAVLGGQVRRLTAELEAAAVRAETAAAGSASTAEVIALQRQVISLSDEVRVAKDGERRRLEEAFELRSHNTRLREETASALAKRSEALAQVEAMTAQLAATKALLEEREGALSVLREETGTLRAQREDLAKRADGMAAQLASLASPALSRAEAAAAELNKLTADLQRAQESLRRAGEDKALLREEAEDARARIGLLEVRCRQAEGALALLRAQVAAGTAGGPPAPAGSGGAEGPGGAASSGAAAASGGAAAAKGFLGFAMMAASTVAAKLGAAAAGAAPGAVSSDPILAGMASGGAGSGGRTGAGSGLGGGAMLPSLRDSWVPVSFADLPLPSRTRHRIALRSDEITAMRFVGGYGERLAVAAADGTVTILDTTSGRGTAVFSLGAPSVAVLSVEVALGGGGGTLYAGATDRAVHAFDIATQRLVRTLTGHVGRITALHFVPPVAPVEAAGASARSSAGAAGGSSSFFGFGSSASAAPPTPAGASYPRGLLISASSDKCVRLWDARDCRCVRSIDTRSMVNDIAVEPAGSLVWTAHQDGSVRMFDLRNSGAMLAETPPSLHGGAAATCVRLSAAGFDGGRFLLTAGRDNTLHTLDASNLQPLSPLPAGDAHGHGAHHSAHGHGHAAIPAPVVLKHSGYASPSALGRAALSPSGQLAVGGSANGRIFAWRVTTGALEVEIGGSEKRARKASAAATAAASGGGGGSLLGGAFAELADDAAGAAPPPVGHDKAVQVVDFAPDGSLLASGDASGVVVLWEA